jgi:hypothetical protein
MKSAVIALTLSALCASASAAASPTDGLTIVTTDANGNDVEEYKGRYENGPGEKRSPQDGLMITTTDEYGKEVETFMGRFEEGPSNQKRSETLVNSAKFDKRRSSSYVGTQCGGSYGFSESDYEVALQGMANYFGNGQSFSGKIWYTYGNAVIFGCDYGHGQTFTSSQLYSDLGAVDTACPNGQTGWYDHEPWKSSYGRIVTGQGFC